MCNIYLCGLNWSGTKLQFKFNYVFLNFIKHRFDVHMDKSLKFCTNVEQILLFKDGLLLSIDIAIVK